MRWRYPGRLRPRQRRRGTERVQPELPQHFVRGIRIDREPRPHCRSCRVVNLVDQPRGQFDKLPRLVLAVPAGLDVEIGQHPQQGGADIDTFPPGERDQSIEAWKQ